MADTGGRLSDTFLIHNGLNQETCFTAIAVEYCLRIRQ